MLVLSTNLTERLLALPCVTVCADYKAYREFVSASMLMLSTNLNAYANVTFYKA
jgi:hypothetical protein